MADKYTRCLNMTYTQRDAEWDRFTGHLLGYIQDYFNQFIKNDYLIETSMTYYEMQHELISEIYINDFSPDLQKIAKQYLETAPEKYNLDKLYKNTI